MKSYNGLFKRMLDPNEIIAGIEETAKHRTHRPVVAKVLERKEDKAAELAEAIRNRTWRPPRHQVHRLQEGAHRKMREIQKPRFDDEQIVHHLLMRQFRPIVQPRLYRYVYGSLPGRGPHEAVAHMKRWRDEYSRKRFYCFEGDIRKFYDNVDIDLLKGKLRKRIRDKRYLEVLEQVIDTAAPGLPKGFYTSPWLANFYLEDFDNFVVQVLKPDHYLRYMDNLFIFHRNKKELHRMVRQIQDYLDTKLHLHLKDDWQVYRFEGTNRRTGNFSGRAVNALGFVIRHNRVTIRKSCLKRTRAKAHHIHKRRRYTRHDSASMISRMGAFKHANAYGYYLREIKPYVSIHYCKRRLSQIAKRQNRKDGKSHDGI